MLEYIDTGYLIMFFFGFLIDKINLFPFLLGIFLGLYISAHKCTIQYYELFNNIYGYFKKQLDIIFINQNNEDKTSENINYPVSDNYEVEKNITNINDNSNKDDSNSSNESKDTIKSTL